MDMDNDVGIDCGSGVGLGRGGQRGQTGTPVTDKQEKRKKAGSNALVF